MIVRHVLLNPYGFNAIFGDDDEQFRKIFDALMTQEEDEELDEAVAMIEETPRKWPDEFRYEMKGLQNFRKFYGRRKGDYTLEQRMMLKAYDKYWTEELVRKLLGLKPEVVAEEPPTLEVR